MTKGEEKCDDKDEDKGDNSDNRFENNERRQR